MIGKATEIKCETEFLRRNALTSNLVKIIIADATHMFSCPVPHVQDKNYRHSLIPFFQIQLATACSQRLMLILS
jgi:hypothetical protein